MKTLFGILLLVASVDAFGYSAISFGNATEKDLQQLQTPDTTCPCSYSVDNKGHNARIVIGGHATKYVAVEVDYTYIGQFSTTASDYWHSYRLAGESDTFALSTVFTIPVSKRFTIMPKIGYAYYDIQYTGYVDGQQMLSQHQAGNVLVKGIGIQYQLTGDLGVRAEQDVYGSETNLTTIGLVFNY